MKPRTLVLLTLSIVCGLAASYLTAQFLRPRTVTVLVATRPIPRGAALTDYSNLFVPSEIPANTTLPANCVVSYDQIKDRARDTILKQALHTGDPLSADNLIDRRQAGLVWNLRPGYTGLAIRATPESSFFGLLEPDNYVKVLGVRKLPGGEKRTVILMKNVRVLAVDRAMEMTAANTQKSGVPSIITLEVTDDEAKRLAQEEGALTLGVMSPNDLNDRQGETVAAPVVKTTPEVRTPTMKRVLVSAGPLPRGATLRDLAMIFQEREVPEEQVPENAVTSTTQLREGLTVVKPMKAGEPLSLDYLMAPPAEPESLLTIIGDKTRRVYARKPDGRARLVEMIHTSDDAEETKR